MTMSKSIETIRSEKLTYDRALLMLIRTEKGLVDVMSCFSQYGGLPDGMVDNFEMVLVQVRHMKQKLKKAKQHS